MGFRPSPPPGGGGGSLALLNEGVAVPGRSILDFKGLDLDLSDDSVIGKSVLRMISQSPIDPVDEFGASNLGTGDQQVAVNLAHDKARAVISGVSAGKVRYRKGVFRVDSLKDGTNCVDTEKTIVQGDGSGVSRISIGHDMGPGTYALNFQKTESATQPYIGVRDIDVWGPNGSGIMGVTPNQMEGVRLGNLPKVEGYDIRNFHSGLYLFKDHEIIGPGKSTSNFYNVYVAGTQSAGDQWFNGVNMSSPFRACVGVAAGSHLGGVIFQRCQLGDGPFSFYKEGGFGVTPVDSLFVTFASFIGCSFENFNHAILYSEAYGNLTQKPGSTADCSLLTFIRCFVSAPHTTGKVIDVPYGDGSTYMHGTGQQIPSGYPADAPFMGCRITGLRIVGGDDQPFVVPTFGSRADLSFLAAGLGALENVEIGDVKGKIDNLAYDAQSGRKLFHFDKAGVVNDIGFKYGGSRGSIRRAAATFAAKELIEWTDDGTKVQRSTGTRKTAGVAMEAATSTTDCPAFVYDCRNGDPVPVLVDASHAGDFSTAGKWAKASTAFPGTVELATGPTDGQVVGRTTGVHAAGSVPLKVFV